jgi:hypothetical protein
VTAGIPRRFSGRTGYLDHERSRHRPDEVLIKCLFEDRRGNWPELLPELDLRVSARRRSATILDFLEQRVRANLAVHYLVHDTAAREAEPG